MTVDVYHQAEAMGRQFNTDVMEAIVIGAGVATVLYSINDLTTSVGLVIGKKHYPAPINEAL